jgi:hypothetical protein
MKQFPSVETRTEYIPFGGGLDLVSPALNIAPGSLIGVQNYVADLNGGYRMYGAFERYSGQTAPSSATQQAVACTLTSTPAIGATVTIGASFGLFAGVIDGGCVLTGVIGTVPGGTSMTVSGSPVGTTLASPVLTSPTQLQDAQRTALAADVYRALIAAPAGSGPIRGVVQFQSLTYCFRDNVGATAGQMFVSSSSGWTLVPLGEEVVFTNADVGVNESDTLTQGGVTALIGRVIVESGSLASGVNTGRLTISGRMGGNYAAGAATTTGAGALTLSSAQTANSLPPGGRYEFDIYNFYGQLTSLRLYGANGVGNAFEFDGTVFLNIKTGASTDTPAFIKSHRRYLYLAIGASLINSSVGTPTRFVTAEGASEIATGDVITGLASLPGEALGIMGRNSSQSLTGASSASWSLNVIRADVGAVAYTVQTMGDTFMADDRGITSVQAVQNYGNFSSSTASTQIQPLIDRAKNLIVGSFLSRRLGLYVLVLTTGSAIAMTARSGKLLGFTQLQFPFTPTCAFSGEDSTGTERIFIGASNGFVYELEKGQSADGADFEAFIRLAYSQSKSPRVKKRYRKMVLQVAAQQYTSLRFSGELSFGSNEASTLSTDTAEPAGAGGYWDVSNWDEFYWDGQDVSEPEISLAGTGTNIALTFYKKNALDAGHILQGAVIHYTPRRLQR